jgi:cation diffusion facilitator family transporter
LSDQSVKASELAAKKGILSSALLAVVEVTGALLSGSLGLLSSAVNTLMDFMAAIITFFAVREGSKPPDEVHMYGHEKIESTAAIGEILLLLIVCAWITYTAVSQLVSGGEELENFWIGLGTNFISIAVDIFAYMSMKLSTKKRKSGAMEAGALHFLNDLLIAFVVIIGLGFYRFGVWYADSIAALVIVVFIIYSSMSVVRDSAAVLLDTAPRGIVKELRGRILGVEGVKDCHHIRIRRAGSKFFVDAHVEIEGHIPLNQVHSITSRIEEEIMRVFPNSDVLIHTEPYTAEDPLMVIRDIASQFAEIKGIHGIIVRIVGGKLSISYHLELESRISVKDAHDIASRLEDQVRAKLHNVSTIISHLEPTTELMKPMDESPKELNRLEHLIVQVSQSFPEVRSSHEIQILTSDKRYSVTLHCTIDDSMTLAQAHEIATKMEEKIKRLDEKIEQVTIHCEPESEISMVSNSQEV